MTNQRKAKSKAEKCSKILRSFLVVIREICKDQKMCCPKLILVWLDYISLYLNGTYDRKEIEKTKSALRCTPTVRLSLGMIPPINSLVDLYAPLADCLESINLVGPLIDLNLDLRRQLESFFESLQKDVDVMAIWGVKLGEQEE